MSTTDPGSETTETSSKNSVPALPAPDVSGGVTPLAMEQTIKLDELGPMVVNSDGTLSRIANWKAMTPQEQERTIRVLGARNKIRIAKEEARLQAAGPGAVEDASTSL